MFSRSFRSAAGVGFLFAVTSTAVLCTAALDANGASAANGGTNAFEQTTDESDYSLTGIVVNSVTGAPIRSALVQITFSRQLSTLTGSDGKFKFEGLPSGQTAVSVRKPGFFSEEEIHSLTNTQRMFSTGPDSAPAVLKLVPEGVIFGTIRGEEGEPLEGMNVRLTRNSFNSGHKRREAQATVQTDETGAFRFAELIPAIYFLSVSQGGAVRSGSPWANHPTKRERLRNGILSGSSCCDGGEPDQNRSRRADAIGHATDGQTVVSSGRRGLGVCGWSKCRIANHGRIGATAGGGVQFQSADGPFSNRRSFARILYDCRGSG